MSYAHEQDKIKNRWPDAEKFIVENKLNEMFGPEKAPVGIVVQGGMYNGVIRALQRLGLADVFGETEVPLYVLNVTYPLVRDEFVAFCAGKDTFSLLRKASQNSSNNSLATSCTRRVAT